jgi:putative membrane protein
MMYGNHMDAGGWVLSVFVTLLVVTLIVLAIVWLVRTQTSVAPARLDDVRREPARELLDRRLASGEIDEDEYRRLRAALSEAPTPAEPERTVPA